MSPVLYDVAFRFKAAANGQHRFVLISEPDDFASFYLYEGSFDPDNGFENCVAGDNSTDDAAGTKTIIEYDATRRTRYIVVVFDDTFDQVGGDYTLVTKAPVGRVVGPGRRFVKMPDRIKCADARAVATWRARADQVESAMFKANTNNKVVASVTHIVPGRKVVLTGIPPAARRLTGVLKLESGSKLQVRRDYIRC